MIRRDPFDTWIGTFFWTTVAVLLVGVTLTAIVIAIQASIWFVILLAPAIGAIAATFNWLDQN